MKVQYVVVQCTVYIQKVNVKAIALEICISALLRTVTPGDLKSLKSTMRGPEQSGSCSSESISSPLTVNNSLCVHDFVQTALCHAMAVQYVLYSYRQSVFQVLSVSHCKWHPVCWCAEMYTAYMCKMYVYRSYELQ